MLAASIGYAAIMKKLIAAGATIDAVTFDGTTALMLATVKNHIEIIQMFIAEGIDINIAQNNGMTALHLAVRDGHSEVLKVLIDAGADFTKRDKEGKTAMQFAKLAGYFHIVDILEASQQERKKSYDHNQKRKAKEEEMGQALKKTKIDKKITVSESVGEMVWSQPPSNKEELNECNTAQINQSRKNLP